MQDRERHPKSFATAESMYSIGQGAGATITTTMRGYDDSDLVQAQYGPSSEISSHPRKGLPVRFPCRVACRYSVAWDAFGLGYCTLVSKGRGFVLAVTGWCCCLIL